ncbi:Cytochrome c-type biogenesis protein CcmC, putative heme lyase for CcmE [hydrothermal vent metagenome]|uniref:Cytochrome c-type biogenesis protein CcmC, putative heme lyase for CcmE n=1 Tax=hydrothermal vent metagenome TaxID=652676 RepID=A0A1W1BWL2_9ZZZZ
MWKWIKKCASPKYFYEISDRIATWFLWSFIVLTIIGVYWGLFIAPIDYQQGDSYRIIFVHVPAAWLSMFIYIVMAIYAIIALVWKIKLANIVVKVSAPIGAGFTFIALVTGSIWGKPMWGTWWVWDARLTSELILLFLYFGYIALYNSFDNHKTASKMSNILVLVGVVNIPIIHYSVKWWNTLHQGATVSKIGMPSIHIEMLIPLLIMAIAFKFFYGYLLLYKARIEVLLQEQNSKWVKELLK